MNKHKIIQIYFFYQGMVSFQLQRLHCVKYVSVTLKSGHTLKSGDTLKSSNTLEFGNSFKSGHTLKSGDTLKSSNTLEFGNSFKSGDSSVTGAKSKVVTLHNSKTTQDTKVYCSFNSSKRKEKDRL